HRSVTLFRRISPSIISYPPGNYKCSGPSRRTGCKNPPGVLSFGQGGGTMEEREILEGCVLFRGLDLEETLTQLGGRREEYPARTVAVQEGERVDRLEILLTGTMRAVRLDADGSEVLYQQLYPGYLVAGEVACTPKRTSPYSVCTLEPCAVWRV